MGRIKILFISMLMAFASGFISKSFAQSDVKQAVDSKTNPGSNSDIMVKLFMREINKLEDVALKYTGGTTPFYTARNLDWVFRAVSQSSREDFFQTQTKGGGLTQTGIDELNIALDGLNEICKQKLPLVMVADNLFSYHDASIEKLMQNDIKDKEYVKVHKIGTSDKEWISELDSRGVPLYRYKRFQMVIRNSTNDHDYCIVIYYSFQQDYIGNGSYAETKMASSKQEIVGCP